MEPDGAVAAMSSKGVALNDTFLDSRRCSLYVLSMPVSPPYDRPIALACTMRSLRGRWLHARCRCGHITPHPIQLMLSEQPALTDRTLADALVNLRCNGCRQRARLTVHLCEKAGGPEPGNRDLIGWVLLLHDGAGQPPEAMARSRAAE